MSNYRLAQSDPPFSPSATSQIIAWARQAGQIAKGHLSYVRQVLPDYKPDDTLLTQADVEVEQFLMKQILAAYPDFGLISEEGGRVQGAPTSPHTWVIDPLDGTTAFVQGLPGWGIALGLLQAGQPVFGLFYMPLLDDLTYTTANSIWGDGQTLHKTAPSDWGRKGFLAVSAGAHYDFEIDVPRTRALGSAGANLVYTARGQATAAFIPKAYVWDLAPGAAILSRAGGELRYLSGRPVEYEPLLDGRLAPEPIIAGHPELLVELESAIRPRVN